MIPSLLDLGPRLHVERLLLEEPTQSWDLHGSLLVLLRGFIVSLRRLEMLTEGVIDARCLPVTLCDPTVQTSLCIIFRSFLKSSRGFDHCFSGPGQLVVAPQCSSVVAPNFG